MNILSLLGGRILWAGDGDSLQALVSNLLPDQFAAIMAVANADRAEHQTRVAAKAAAREARKTAVTAAMGAVASAAGARVSFEDDDEDDADEEKYYYHSASYRLEGNTAIIGIRGALVNSDAWYLKYLGAVGYPHIVDQAMRAYNDSRVTNIVLDISSPGGAVSGVNETTQVLQAVDMEKPIVSYTSNMMCSGGYWLGVSGRKIISDSLAQVGSIGVAMTHLEYSKMLEQNGITATVLRKGEYKMLMTPYEPMSDKARAEAKHDMDVIYDAFTMHVAVGRGVSQDMVKKDMAEGRVFWGQEARQVGLVDEIGDISLAVANSQQLADNRPATATFGH